MSSSESQSEDPQLRRVVMEYLADLEAGRRPDRATLAARFPDLTGDLATYLDALEAVQAAAPLLGPPPRTEPAPALAGPEPLGDFRIIREIGRGGMGVVYEAVQLSLGRSVALKVLPFATALDARQLQRFKNEARAAAQLHHPHVVPVYFVGCDRGVHYYAMQLIEGQNLASLLDNVRRSKQKPADSETLRETPFVTKLGTQRSGPGREFFHSIARLIAQAAEGLEYAHGLGIIHRDVKPGNVLIDSEGHVWVTDFGLAQFQTDAALTQTGDLLGTMRYLSPEQASGQRRVLDQRTDVYSLGATLYEAVTLTPLFTGHDRQELLHQVLNEEPRPPRSVDARVPEELETIILKAISKSPSDRYGSARELADDLNRFLGDEPIHARRITLSQKVRRWFRRHPAFLQAGVIVLLTVMVALLVSLWLVRAEQGRTRQAYEGERRRAEEAEAQFRLARRSVDEMIRLAEEETTADPQLRKRLLEAAAAYYQEFIETREHDPEAQTDLTGTRDRVKTILDDLTVLQGADQIALLRERDVWDDLRLSIAQRTAIAALANKLSEQRAGSAEALRGLSLEERRQLLVSQARANESAVAAALSADQLARLRQIALQVQGPAAFRQPDVIEQLQLTAEQREQIRLVAPPHLGPGKFDRPPRRGGMIGEGKKHPRDSGFGPPMDRILDILNADQKATWRQMVGRPFFGRPFGKEPKDRGPRP